VPGGRLMNVFDFAFKQIDAGRGKGHDGFKSNRCSRLRYWPHTVRGSVSSPAVSNTRIPIFARV